MKVRRRLLAGVILVAVAFHWLPGSTEARRAYEKVAGTDITDLSVNQIVDDLIYLTFPQPDRASYTALYTSRNAAGDLVRQTIEIDPRDNNQIEKLEQAGFPVPGRLVRWETARPMTVGFTHTAAPRPGMSREEAKQAWKQLEQRYMAGNELLVKEVKSITGIEINFRPSTTFVRETGREDQNLKQGDVLIEHVYASISKSPPIRVMPSRRFEDSNITTIKTFNLFYVNKDYTIFHVTRARDTYLRALGIINMPIRSKKMTYYDADLKKRRLTEYGKIILSVLYDPRIHAGMDKATALDILPGVVAEHLSSYLENPQQE